MSAELDERHLVRIVNLRPVRRHLLDLLDERAGHGAAVVVSAAAGRVDWLLGRVEVLQLLFGAVETDQILS